MTLFWRFLALLGLGLGLLPGVMLGSVRLAILADGETAAVADLLTAELSKTAGIELVEREELARIVRELALTATGRAGGENALRLGRLSRADGVALLVPGPKGGSDGGTLRLLAVGPGVGVSDVLLPAAGVDPTVWSRLTAARLVRVLPKLAVKAGEAVPVSLLGLRAAVRPEFTIEPLERELSLALAVRLRGAPEVFVLERQRLDALNTEKELAPAAEETPFWTGGFLLDGAIDRDNLDPARLTLDVRLRARAGAGTATLHVEGARGDGPALVEELAGKILAAIGRPVAPPAGWDPLAEAAEYEVEGFWAARWNQRPEAEAAFQSAWALGDRHRALAMSLIEVCAHLSGPRRYGEAAPVPPLALAGRALALYRERTGPWGSLSYRQDLDWHLLGCRTLEAASKRLKISAKDATFRREHREELAGLRREVREVAALMRTANLGDGPEPPAPAPGPRAPDLPVDNKPAIEGREIASTVDALQARYAEVWNDGPEGAIAVYRHLFTGGRAAPPADASRVRRGLLIQYFFPPTLPVNGEELGVWQELGVEERRVRWDGFIAELCASRQPSAPFYGRLLAIRRDWGSAEAVAAAGRLMDDLWRERARVFSGEIDFDCLYLAFYIIRERCEHHPGREGFPFLKGPLKDLRFRFVAEFVAHPVEPAVENLLELLPGSHVEIGNFYSLEDCDRLRGMVAGFKGETSPGKLTYYLAGQLKRTLPAEPVSIAPPPPATPPAPDPRCLRVTRRFVPLPGGNIVGLRADDAGGVWADVRLDPIDYGHPDGEPARAALVRMDPATGLKEVIPWEADSRLNPFLEFRGGFEVVGDIPFVSRRDGVFRCDRRTGRWERLPLPVSYPRLRRDGGRLLLATDDAVLRYDLATGQTEVLASARRRPALNVLDALDGFGFPDLYPAPGGGVRAVVRDATYVLDPVTRLWRREKQRQISTGGMLHGPSAAPGEAYTLLEKPDDVEQLPWVLGPPKRDRAFARTGGQIIGDPPANPFHAALRFQAPGGWQFNDPFLRSRRGDVLLWFQSSDAAGEEDPTHRFPPFAPEQATALLAPTAAGLAIAELGRADYWFIPKLELDAHAIR